MAEIVERAALIISIPALLGFILWRNHLQLLARYRYQGVVVPMSKHPTYYWKKKGENVPPAMKRKVYERDNWQCVECRVDVIDGNATTEEEHKKCLRGAKPGNVDHYYIPDDLGGLALYDEKIDSKDNNLATMCQPCNVRKKAQVSERAFKWLAQRGETICLKKN